MAGGLGVGVAAPPPRTCTKTAPPHGGAACGRLLVLRQIQSGDVFANQTKLVGQILAAGLDLVLKVGEAGINPALGGVYPLLQPLERAGDGYGDFVAVLVDDTLNEFEVFLL